MSLLKKYLGLLKINRLEDMTQMERKQYYRWQEELSGKPMTMANFKEFLEGQAKIADKELESWDNPKEKEIYFKALKKFCNMAVGFIESPEKIRAAAEREIRANIKELEK